MRIYHSARLPVFSADRRVADGTRTRALQSRKWVQRNARAEAASHLFAQARTTLSLAFHAVIGADCQVAVCVTFQARKGAAKTIGKSSIWVIPPVRFATIVYSLHSKSGDCAALLRKGTRMRRVALLLVVAVVVLAMAGGVALAVNRTCLGAVGAGGTPAPDCVGTRAADTLTAGDDNLHNIVGMEGNDIITGGEGQDNIYGDEGNDSITDNEDMPDLDFIWGDEGNDTIRVREGNDFGDTVNCGSGAKDRVFFDRGMDSISSNCEIRNPGQ